jgi:membrane-bound serine protease (ClpP class)
MALLVGTFIFIIHIAVIPSFHRKPVTGRESMIGVQCRVVKPCTPLGVVFVNGECWNAQSVDDNLDVDERVKIVGLEGLTLKVKRESP